MGHVVHPRPISSQLIQRFTAADLSGTSNTQKIQIRTTNDEYREHNAINIYKLTTVGIAQ